MTEAGDNTLMLLVARHEAARTRRTLHRLLDRLWRTQSLIVTMGAWACLAKDVQKRRSEAFFDAMGGQLRAAKRRCTGLEASAVRLRHVSESEVRCTIVAWRGAAQLCRTQRSWLHAAGRHCARRADEAANFLTCRALAAWHSEAHATKRMHKALVESGKLLGPWCNSEPASASKDTSLRHATFLGRRCASTGNLDASAVVPEKRASTRLAFWKGRPSERAAEQTPRRLGACKAPPHCRNHSDAAPVHNVCAGQRPPILRREAGAPPSAAGLEWEDRPQDAFSFGAKR